MSRNSYVRIGEAARLAGVSVDTLRRWEKDGKLTAIRTFGGQRTYRLADIERLRDDEGEDEQDDERPDQLESPARPPVASFTGPALVHPWKAREANAVADLSVTRLKIERREEIRRYREEEQRRIATRLAEAQARAVEARLTERREVERQRHQEALNYCVQLLRIRMIGEPAEGRAEVERFLAQHAAPSVSVEWITAEVNAILDRRRAERDTAAAQQWEADRQRNEAQARKIAEDVQRGLLLSHGERLTRALTADREQWDADAADDALESVREHLIETIDSTWTERRVEREIRDVLNEWG